MQAPPAANPYMLELVRSSFAICVALITLGLTWFVGQKLGSRWAVWQKKREIELASISEFYQMYGEFLAIWRTWKFASGWEAPEREAMRRKLFERSAIANGKIEAIIAKVAIERVLNPAEISSLGLFRQAYQRLCDSLRDDQVSRWRYDDEEYVVFKNLASDVGCILHRETQTPRPDIAARNLERITSIRSKNLAALVAEYRRSKNLPDAPLASGPHDVL